MNYISILSYGHYDYTTVAISILLAMFTSFMALQMQSSVREVTEKRSRFIALTCASLSLGIGIWAMHFTGMLALHLPTPVSYDPFFTSISIIPAILASACALMVICIFKCNQKALITGAILLSLGIGSMHFIGMSAMLMIPEMHHDHQLVIFALLLGLLFGYIALSSRRLISKAKGFKKRIRLNLASGIVMGLAVSGVHYTSMEATRIAAPPGFIMHAAIRAHDQEIVSLEALIITISTVGIVITLSLLLYLVNTLTNVRSNEKRLRTLMDTAPEGIIIFNHKGIITGANQAAYDILGWKEQALLDHSIDCILAPDVYYSMTRSISQYIKTQEPNYLTNPEEINAITMDGATLPIRLAIGHAMVEGEDLFVVFFSDISEQQAMEQALVRAKEKAEQAAAIKTAFLANMSHEIRTPMNTIIGFSEILLETDLTAKQEKYLNNIHQATRSLLHILNDILDSAKLEKGRLELERLNFSLVEEMDIVFSTLYGQARAKGLPLKLKLDSTLKKYYFGASDRIRQVLINLIGNAIKFTQEGKVTLSVSPAADDQVRFDVEDTGIGINPDRIGSIFAPFTQADISTTRRFGGTGLGTTISKQLVELMGGKIWVKSIPGKGSCFSFIIPLPEGSEVDTHRDSVKEYTLPPLRFLVADDVEQNLELLRLRLGADHHQITTAENGQQAVEKFFSAEYDMVLMDIQMPEMDGLQATRLIRQREKEQARTAIPIIALTASVMSADKKASREAGMNGFVKKPVDLNELYREVARISGVTLIPKQSHRIPQVNSTASLKQLDLTEAMSIWQNMPKYLKELRYFIDHQGSLAERLEKILQQEEWSALAYEAHAAKGVAGNLAMKPLMQLCEQIELAAKSQHLEECYLLNSDIRQCLIGIKEELQQLIPEHETTLPQQQANIDSHHPVAELLIKDMLELAANNEIDETVLEQFHAHPNLQNQELTIRIVDSFNEFEFQKAYQQLVELQKILSIDKSGATEDALRNDKQTQTSTSR